MLKEANENQLKEMNKLDHDLAQQKEVKEKLNSANQMIKELECRVRQLESELLDTKETLSELQTNEMKSYKTKLIKALNEVSSLQHQLHTKDSEVGRCKETISELMDELQAVESKRFGFEREIEVLKQEIVELKQQITRLKGTNLSPLSLKPKRFKSKFYFFYSRLNNVSADARPTCTNMLSASSQNIYFSVFGIIFLEFQMVELIF